MMRRAWLLTVLLLLMGAAAAQGRLVGPVFYYVTSPQLEIGVPLQGQLSEDDGRNFKDGSYVDVFVFWGTEGESVEIVASSLEVDVFLSLYGPGGVLLDYNDDDWMTAAHWSTDAAVRTVLPSTGTYVVVVSGYSEYDLGAYTVQRNAFVEPTGQVFDVLAPGLFATNLGSFVEDSYLLDLSEPVTLTATLRSADFDAYLEVYDASGVLVAYNDDFEPSGLDAQLVLDMAPGRYNVVVSAYYGQGSGAYSLDLDW